MSRTHVHGHLSILIKEGHHLKNMEWVGKSDPYVIVELDETKICRTDTIDHNLDPVWNHPLALEVCAAYSILKFTIYDENELRPDALMGTVEIPISKIVEEKHLSDRFDLSPENRGQLELQIEYISADSIAQTYEVPEVPFQLRHGNRVSLYTNAHWGTDSGIQTPIVVTPHRGYHTLKQDEDNRHHASKPDQRDYYPGDCWVDVTRAFYNAKKFIYITGWSVWTELHLVRADFPDDVPREFAELTLGEILKKKADEGVRVLVMIWDEATSGVCGFGGFMGTHDEETFKYFEGSNVHVKKALRKGKSADAEFIWTHHQKSIILDADAGHGHESRRIIAFVGGLDLCDGRYDNPRHPLFRSLETLHKDDFHQVWKGVTQEYGPREPWHDIHGRLEGPVARDVLTNFESRWQKQNEEHVDLLIDHSDGFITVEQEAHQLAGESQWDVQFFRSIDHFSAIMTPPGLEFEKSIQEAYIHQIRRAKHFIYIENQYFMGSAQDWCEHAGHGISCNNLIPVEVTEKIVSQIKNRKRFAAYILVPMYPEGIPADGTTQEILRWQWETMTMMYRRIYKALEEENLLDTHKPEDYLNFYCLGNRETTEGSQAVLDHCDEEDRPVQIQLLKTRRFIVYVHAKMMIVDDEYIILGSANINERSMAGTRDTEIAIGAYQPKHVATSTILPHGDVQAFRLAIWASHTGNNYPEFREPQSVNCVQRVNQIADKNLHLFANDEEVVDLPSLLMKYPVSVGENGFIVPHQHVVNVPDTEGPIHGKKGNVPSLLTE